jgi:hypothetical protein
MGPNNEQKDYIKEVIINCLRVKFKHYHPESNNMPFHYRLLGKDRMALILTHQYLPCLILSALQKNQY